VPIQGLTSDGRLAVFATEPDGSLGRVWQTTPGNGWSDWERLGAVLDSAPVVAVNSDGRLELFAIGPAGLLGNMWQDHGPGGWWSEWSELGPQVRSAPVVIQNADGHFELFAIGSDGRLGHMWQRPHGGGWSPWHVLGPTLRGAPTAVQNADGRLELFAVGPDGVLGNVWQLDPNAISGWSEWTDLEITIAGDPVVFENADGGLELFAIGPNGRLGHMWQHRPAGLSGWSEWTELGPEILTPPAVFRNADGCLELFAAGPGGSLGHIRQREPNGRGGWSGWEPLGPQIAGQPSVFVDSDGRLELFALGPDGRLGHMRQREPNGLGGWSDWEPLGPAISEHRAAVCQATSRGTVDRQRLTDLERRARSSWPLVLKPVLSADVCVIGAGPAGVTVSEGLIRAGASVILIESGGWRPDPVANELNRGVTYGQLVKGYQRYLSSSRSRQVQGAASGWGPGWCMPFRTIDFERRPWVAHSDWPLSEAELAPYKARAEATFDFAAFEAPEVNDQLIRCSYHFPPDPELFRTAFLGLLPERRFGPEFGTTAVELSVNGDRIDSVRCARLGGGELRVSADTVVLAGGAIENARLLLLNERALGAGTRLAGRYFMEHPHVLAGSVLIPDAERLESYFQGPGVLDVLGLSDQAQREQELLNATVQLRPIDYGAPGEPVECELYVRAEQAPNPDSLVFLGDRRDRFGCRQPVLHWRMLEQDWESIVHTTGLVASALEQRYGAHARVEITSDAPWPADPNVDSHAQYGTWGNHHLGTTRMAEEPEDGVVDRNCLVHGTANLYVAGSSVFSTGGAANPTFTIGALAHRLADHLSGSQ